MISKKIQNLFLISIFLFIAHGLEEYFTGFYNVDSLFYFAFRHFENMSVFQAAFLVFQIMLWVLLVISYLLIFKKNWLSALLTIPAIVSTVEIHHLIKAVIHQGYYPGSVTAFVLFIFGFFYWKELIKLYKAKK